MADWKGEIGGSKSSDKKNWKMEWHHDGGAIPDSEWINWEGGQKLPGKEEETKVLHAPSLLHRTNVEMEFNHRVWTLLHRHHFVSFEFGTNFGAGLYLGQCGISRFRFYLFWVSFSVPSRAVREWQLGELYPGPEKSSGWGIEKLIPEKSFTDSELEKMISKS